MAVERMPTPHHVTHLVNPREVLLAATIMEKHPVDNLDVDCRPSRSAPPAILSVSHTAIPHQLSQTLILTAYTLIGTEKST